MYNVHLNSRLFLDLKNDMKKKCVFEIVKLSRFYVENTIRLGWLLTKNRVRGSSILEHSFVRINLVSNMVVSFSICVIDQLLLRMSSVYFDCSFKIASEENNI